MAKGCKLGESCPECQQAKARQKKKMKAENKAKSHAPRMINKFGQIVTCDHVVMRDKFKQPGIGSSAVVFEDVISVSARKSIKPCCFVIKLKYSGFNFL